MVRALIYSSMYTESFHSSETIAQLLSHPTSRSLPHLTALLPPSLLRTALLPPSLLRTAPYSSSLPCTAISLLLSSLEAVPVPMVSSGAVVVESAWRPGGSCGPISMKDPARVEEAQLWLVMLPQLNVFIRCYGGGCWRVGKGWHCSGTVTRYQNGVTGWRRCAFFVHDGP